MTKDRWLAGLVALVVILLVALTTAHVLYSETDQVTVENFRKIKGGMTEIEVRRILGREYRRTNEVWFFPYSQWGSIDRVLVWTGKEARIHVGFNHLGWVHAMTYTERDKDKD